MLQEKGQGRNPAVHLHDWMMEVWGAVCRSGLAPGDVEVAIDPAELEGLDDAGVRALYEERLAQQRTASSREVG